MSTLHIVETKTGTVLPDTIERTRAASIAWTPDNSGFYYTRYPKKGDVPDGQEMYNRHVFYHVLGDDPTNEDKPIFGEGRDAEDWPSVHLSSDGHWLLISVSQGWTKSELYLMDVKKGTPPTRITTGKNFLYGGEVYKDKIYITTNDDAPRYRVFVADAGNYDREAWKELIPQSDAVLQGTAVFGGKLFAQYEQNATSQLKIFDLDGTKLSDLTLPALGTVFGTGGRWNHDEVFYGFQSFTFAPSIYRVDLKSIASSDPQGLKPVSVAESSGTAESRALPKTVDRTPSSTIEPVLWTKVDAPSIDPAGYDVNQEWFQSKDGTRVPMFVVHKKGVTKNGKNPTLLTAYGGFNVSLTPSFSRAAYLWMEHGGVYAVANLRGGGRKFGEALASRRHARKTERERVRRHDRCLRAPDRRKIYRQESSCHPGRVERAWTFADGRHAMSAARPDLFQRRGVPGAAARHAALPGFAGRIAKLWIPEYGSSENPEQFKWLYAYSPYHHVKAGTEYPAILFMTADTDTRVDPMHAKKMAALMQAEAKNGASKTRPILLRIESKAGHGAGKPVTKQIEEFTDVYSFLFWQLGVRP